MAYECDADKHLSDGATSYDVPCQQSGNDFIFQYDTSKYCKAVCEDEPPAPSGVDRQISAAKDAVVNGYWENTYAE